MVAPPLASSSAIRLGLSSYHQRIVPGLDFLMTPATAAIDRAPAYLVDTRAHQAPGKLQGRAELPELLGAGLPSWRAGELPLRLARSTNPAAAMTPNVATRIKDVMVQAMMIASCSRPVW
jgi:hypothetical protein